MGNRLAASKLVTLEMGKLIRESGEEAGLSVLSRPELPFGGVKRSGYGRELDHLVMVEFANPKLICTVPADAPIGDFAG